MKKSSSRKLQHPIVLVPGLVFPKKILFSEYFLGIRTYLEEAGNSVFIPELSKMQTIERRARELKRQILKEFKDETVNVIAHSMGGLNARYMASVLGMGKHVASITTIGTPHRGSPLADLMVKAVPLQLYKTANYLMKNIFSSNMRAWRHISIEHMEKIFNEKVSNVPGINYYSVASYIPEPAWRNSFPVMWPSQKYINIMEGKNDGMVSVNSAKWGKFIGSYPGDHFSQVGHPFGVTFFANHEKMFSDILMTLAESNL